MQLICCGASLWSWQLSYCGTWFDEVHWRPWFWTHAENPIMSLKSKAENFLRILRSMRVYESSYFRNQNTFLMIYFEFSKFPCRDGWGVRFIIILTREGAVYLDYYIVLLITNSMRLKREFQMKYRELQYRELISLQMVLRLASKTLTAHSILWKVLQNLALYLGITIHQWVNE